MFSPMGWICLCRIVQGLPKRFGKWPERPAMRRSYLVGFQEIEDFFEYFLGFPQMEVPPLTMDGL